MKKLIIGLSLIVSFSSFAKMMTIEDFDQIFLPKIKEAFSKDKCDLSKYKVLEDSIETRFSRVPYLPTTQFFDFFDGEDELDSVTLLFDLKNRNDITINFKAEVILKYFGLDRNRKHKYKYYTVRRLVSTSEEISGKKHMIHCSLYGYVLLDRQL